MGFSTLSSVNCNYCTVGLGWKSSSLFPHLNSFPKIISNGVLLPHKKSYKLICFPRASASSSSDPLLVKAARGEPVNRPPAWMMRQAGRYMAVYRKLAEKHPSFRQRSETIDLIVQISLQPWEAFHPDGVIIFSDILTPLPAFGVPFDIEEIRGPVIQSPIRTQEDLKALHPIDLEKLQFVGDSLRILRNEVGNQAAVLGFVGAPWTIATYIVEGGTTRTYTTIKSMCHKEPHLLRALLSHLAKAIAEYIIFQVESGAHCIQIFDSWGGQLPPVMWDQWSKPYIEEIVRVVKEKCPQTPLVLYINGNGGFLERMKTTGVDVIGLDWTVDMADGRKRLGTDISIQGNVDPAYLFSPLPALTNEIKRVVKCAGTKGHILNLGHGVLVGTPEEAVAHFFDVARSLKFDTQVEKNDAVWVGHDVDHFTNPEGVPGVPETNFNNRRPNSFKVLSPPRTCVVYYRVEEDLNGVKENDESSSYNDADASEMLHDVNNLREETYSAEKKKDG